MNLDQETGVSLIRMVKKMDAGPVFNIQTTLIKNKTTGDLMHELGEIAADLLIRSLPLIENGSLKPTPQDEKQVTFAKIITRDDEAIDFHQPAKMIEAKVRALSLSPLAYVHSNEGPIKLTQVKLSELNGPPGEIMEVKEDGVRVGCQDQSLWLMEGIPAGKAKMNLTDFYRGHPHLSFSKSDDEESLSYP
jgi:methionyl-tRNA formyltransferase